MDGFVSVRFDVSIFLKTVAQIVLNKTRTRRPGEVVKPDEQHRFAFEFFDKDGDHGGSPEVAMVIGNQ
jgi:hypothetical protein